MRHQDDWSGFVQRAQQRVEIPHIVIDGVGLRPRGRDVVAETDVGPVVGAHPGELGDRWQHGVVTALEVASERQVVTRSDVGGLGGVEDLQPVLSAVPLPGDQDHGWRSLPPALDVDLPTTADIHRATDVTLRRSC